MYRAGGCRVVNSHHPLLLFYRDALTQLFKVLGLESRQAGDGGETGYGIPDQGYDDSEAVIKKVRRSPVEILFAIQPCSE